MTTLIKLPQIEKQRQRDDLQYNYVENSSSKSRFQIRSLRNNMKILQFDLSQGFLLTTSTFPISEKTTKNNNNNSSIKLLHIAFTFPGNQTSNSSPFSSAQCLCKRVYDNGGHTKYSLRRIQEVVWFISIRFDMQRIIEKKKHGPEKLKHFVIDDNYFETKHTMNNVKSRKGHYHIYIFMAFMRNFNKVIKKRYLYNCLGRRSSPNVTLGTSNDRWENDDDN